MRAQALPTGTVTFLFTDVEGSTRLWEQHPEQMRAALAEHDALIEFLAERHGGRAVRPRGEGDSRFCVFARATDAVAAAAAIQRSLHAQGWPAEAPLRVRMAVHTGEADLRDGDYYGSAVNRAARLRGIAHGGQAVVSEATYDLVRDALPPDAGLRDLGAHRLRDLFRPERVFQLIVPGVETEFPPLRSLDARPHNLPIQPTPLVGRERELAQVRERLLRAGVRLLTLTGPGGTGKTRLALQAAAEALDEFPGGVWLVELAAVTDPALVPSAVAQVLGVKEAAGEPLVETLKRHVREKHLLLVLDNFEQVAVAAPLVADLLTAAPALKILVTSREVLRLAGEHEYPVPPLTLPDPDRPPPPERLTQYEAVALFVQRAVAARPDFAVTNENAPAVAEICHRLDGLPLAIELAAARVKLLPPQALLARLGSRLAALTGGRRDAPARHQTLRAAIDWSYQLLEPEEQALFARLAVFAGGCTLEAAGAVCGAEGEQLGAGTDVLEGISSLVDKSLVRQEEQAGGEPRFIMLETIREYALERLEESDAAGAVRSRHEAYYLALVAWALRHDAEGRGPADWLVRLEREHGNLRAVLAAALARGDPATVLRLGTDLSTFWASGGYLSEGRRWLEAALADRGEVPSTLQGAALAAAGRLAFRQGDYTAARAFHEEGLGLARERGDKTSTADRLADLGHLASAQSDYAAARALFEEGLALAREAGHTGRIADRLADLGHLASFQRDYAAARAPFEEGLALAREAGHTGRIAGFLSGLGTLARRLEDYAAARGFLEEALILTRERGDKGHIAGQLFSLGHLALLQGDPAAARTFLEEALALNRERGAKASVADTLYSLGELAVRQRDHAAARAFLDEALALVREIGDNQRVAHQLLCLGRLAIGQGDHAAAQALFQEGLGLYRQMGAKLSISDALRWLATTAGALGRSERAARLFGAAHALREKLDVPLSSSERAGRARDPDAVRARLGDEAFTAAWDEGAAMTLEQAVAYTLEEPGGVADGAQGAEAGEPSWR